jgi:lysyl-tRNA synthetase class I
MEVMAAELTEVTALTEATRTFRADTSACTEVIATVLAEAIAETWAIWVPRAETTGLIETTAKAARTETVV